MRRASAVTVMFALAGCYPFSHAPPGGAYVKFADVAPGYSEFVPGLGALYVQPDTRPVGPYRSYDRNGKLTATIYMVSDDALDQHLKLICNGQVPPVDHTQVHWTKGHPGFAAPHHHFTLWHVSSEEAASIK